MQPLEEKRIKNSVVGDSRRESSEAGKLEDGTWGGKDPPGRGVSRLVRHAVYRGALLRLTIIQRAVRSTTCLASPMWTELYCNRYTANVSYISFCFVNNLASYKEPQACRNDLVAETKN